MKIVKNSPTLSLVPGMRIDGPGYIREETPKQSICLHYTAGWDARGAVNAWKAANYRMGTAYVVEKSGTIIEVFPPQYHARHLGVVGQPDPGVIGVEIVNIGWLRRSKDGKDLNFWTGKKYCGWEETDKYVTAPPWREQRYWARYTAEQEVAVGELCLKLCEEFKIEPLFWAQPQQYSPTLAKRWRGILGHQNFRADKTDPGPAWNWGKLMTAVGGQWG